MQLDFLSIYNNSSNHHAYSLRLSKARLQRNMCCTIFNQSLPRVIVPDTLLSSSEINCVDYQTQLGVLQAYRH